MAEPENFTLKIKFWVMSKIQAKVYQVYFEAYLLKSGVIYFLSNENISLVETESPVQ